MSDARKTPRALLERVEHGGDEALAARLSSSVRRLPAPVVDRVEAAWGEPGRRCRSATAPSVSARTVRQCARRAPPDRGRTNDRRAAYHDAALAAAPRAARLRALAPACFKADAMVHMGAHGTLEWLPGKAVALTRCLLPRGRYRRAAGDLSLPRLEPRRGGAGQAPHRRRHHRPSAAAPRRAALSGAAQELERLVDEYALADGLDRRRRERLARLIIESAQRSGLSREAGVAIGDQP